MCGKRQWIYHHKQAQDEREQLSDQPWLTIPQNFQVQLLRLPNFITGLMLSCCYAVLSSHTLLHCLTIQCFTSPQNIFPVGLYCVHCTFSLIEHESELCLWRCLRWMIVSRENCHRTKSSIVLTANRWVWISRVLCYHGCHIWSWH